MIKRHKRKAIVVGCAKMLQPCCQVLSEEDHHAAAMARPMHAKKTNVHATLTPAGLTKCRQASAGISPFDRAAACGGRAVIPGYDDGGLSCATPAAALASILDLRIYLHIVTRPLIDRMTSVYLNGSETTPPCA